MRPYVDDAPPAVIQYNIEDVEQLIERRLKFTSEAWGYASAYDAAITVGGYAAFFALWSGVAEDVTPQTRGLTAAMLGVSLLLYITWTLVVMWARHRFDGGLVKLLQQAREPAELWALWDELELRKQNGLLKLQLRLWQPLFGTAVLLGLGGALLLAYNCLAVALDLPQFVGRGG